MGRLRNEERGQGLVEYALIIALVSLAAIVALGFMSGKINNLFSKAGNSLNNVQVASGGGTTPPPPPPPAGGQTFPFGGLGGVATGSGVDSGDVWLTQAWAFNWPDFEWNVLPLPGGGGLFDNDSHSVGQSCGFTLNNGYAFGGTWHFNVTVLGYSNDGSGLGNYSWACY